MKRVYLSILALLFAGSAHLYSQNDFSAYNVAASSLQEGTARSVAMGNALTALGGDLGAININPASTAVYKFTEMGITPAFTTVGTTSDLFGTSYKSHRTNFGISNAGAVFYLPTYNNVGIKNFNFGIVFTKLNNFSTSEVAKHYGNSSNPTYLNHLADYTSQTANSFGMSASDLADAMDINSSQVPYRDFGAGLWPSILAWNSSLINLHPTEDRFEPTEQATIDQNFRRKSTGYNAATDLSLGLNISDIIFIGLNTTITTVYNKVEETYTESGVGVQDFVGMKQLYDQRTTGTGIGGKLGVIFVPSPNFRIGAAISTPTMHYLTDRARWNMAASLGTDYDVNLRTPEIEMDYKLTTPFKYNIGFSVVYPQFAISADYEGTNLSQTKFHSDGDSFDSYDWSVLNDVIKASYERVDKIKIGLELNPMPSYSFRAGFQYANSGIKDVKIDNYIGSVGAGYSSPNGFFCDLAFTTTLRKTDVLFDGGDILSNYIASSANNTYKRNIWKLLFSVGYRF